MIDNWKDKFDQHILEKAKRHVQNFHIRQLESENGVYTTTIPGNVPADVRIKTEENKIKWMRCSCVLAKTGKNCEHMAAMLYVIDIREMAQKEGNSEVDIILQWKQTGELPLSNKEEATAAVAKSVQKVKAVKGKDLTTKEKNAVEKTAGKKAAKAVTVVKAVKKVSEKKMQEERRREEEKKLQEEKRLQEEKKLQEERKRKNEERRLRKEARAKAEEERKKQEEEKRQAEYEKRKKEEERRAKLREEKANEAKKREDKRKQEQLSIKENERKRELGIDKEYELLGDAWENEETAMEQGGSMDDLMNYHYFNATAIIASKKTTQKLTKAGTEALAASEIQVEDVACGHMGGYGKVHGLIKAVAHEKGRKQEFQIQIYFDREKITDTLCGCPTCRDWYGSAGQNTKMCKYQAGVIGYLREYLENHNIGDSTDAHAMRFLNSFHAMNHRKNKAEHVADEELKLVPKLILKDNELKMSFRFGREKLFVIKNLNEFYYNVQNCQEDVYGANTIIVHKLENFTELGKEWYDLIKRVVQEHNMIMKKMEENYYVDSRDFKIGREIELYGWQLDRVYELMQREPIEFENRDSDSKKTKAVLSCKEKDPRTSMMILPDVSKDKKEFLGIAVHTVLPQLFYGTDVAYMVEESNLCRVSAEYRKATAVLRNGLYGNVFSVSIGRNHLTDFYYHALPELEPYFDIKEIETEQIHSYLIPDVKLRFFLDSDQRNIVCDIKSYYGQQEFSVMDYVDVMDGFQIPMEECRDGFRECQALETVGKYLNAYDNQKRIMHCNGDEEAVYQFMAYGLAEIQELGEVHCTRNFLSIQKVRHLKPVVGLSVSDGGFLELEVTTDDFTAQELVSILRSYKEKKKYYRLKDGSFLGMDEPAIGALADISELLQQKDGKLFKEKIQIPMYRALYLDHLLEENSDIYEKRDRYVKQLLKQFHAMKEADYEVPDSLAKIMRKYQREGFQWLRTLENCGFGGILADEMGLGKTLQTIAMLLSAKEEQKEGCSLIVCPASLVYNWEEEIHKFAPELRAISITGTQQERERLVLAEDYDVKITSYDLLKRDVASYEEQRFLYEVIDEAQYIKNHNTAAAKTVKVIKSQYKFALTGTPVENRLSELWSIFDYLMPGFLYSYEEFRKSFETPIVKNGEAEVMARLQRMIAPFILKRSKADVLKDLPEKLEEVRYVRLDKKQQQIYDGQVIELKKTLASQDESEVNKNKIQILAALTKLRQICCDPNMIFEDYKDVAAKTDACIELIQGAIEGGHRMLVFSQFTSMLDILKERLSQEKIRYFEITGSTTKEKRKALVQEFNEGDVPVFLISLKAGGVGLNLTGADIVIHFDPWWNVAAQNQATDRAHRIGQTKKVTVYKLIAKNTIEEKILQMQEKKKALADQILEGEGVSISDMSKEELLEILS